MLFLFDENLSKSIAESLNVIEAHLGVNKVISTVDINELGRGASDEQILHYSLSLDIECLIITADKDFKKRQLYSQILSQENVGLFWIRFPRGKRKFYDKFNFIVNAWEKIKETSTTSTKPIRFVLETNGRLIKI